MSDFYSNGSSNNDGAPHRFQPGNPGGPGRPKKAHELQILDTIKASWPPERVQKVLDDALAVAIDTRSWRGMLSVVELVLSYGVGRPTQRIETGNAGNLAELLAALDMSTPLLPLADDKADNERQI